MPTGITNGMFSPKQIGVKSTPYSFFGENRKYRIYIRINRIRATIHTSKESAYISKRISTEPIKTAPPTGRIEQIRARIRAIGVLLIFPI